MAYIICEPCVGTKDTACVDVCPVDCIHPRKDEPEFETANMLYVHPEECIDCGACVPACPVEAIYAEDDVPDGQRDWIERNKELAAAWKPLIERKEALPGADEWAKVKDKKDLLER